MRSLLVFVVTLAGCTHAQTVAKAPDYAIVAGEAAPARAALYADCLAQASTQRTYRRAHDADTELLLFTCSGAPARAFYEGLAAWSASIDSQFTAGGRTVRSTTKVRENLFGVDYCSTDGAGGYECVVTLNTGAFLGS
jgi:hypothetical protein